MHKRALVLSCSCLVLACSGTEATPAGLIAQVDLREQLSARALAIPSELDEHEASFEVCTVDDAPFDPVGLRIVWHSFAGDHDDAYIVDFSVFVTEPSKGAVVAVTSLDPASIMGGLSLEAGAPWVDVALVSVTCEREAFVMPKKYKQRLIDQLQIVADGRVLD
jgi:hypothetical protein